MADLAIVFGGASGIGAACVDALRARGDRVVIADLKPPEGDPDAYALDVRDRDAVHAAVGDATERHGPLRALVYAAGTARVTPILEIGQKEWDLVVAVNLHGAFHAVQAGAPAMSEGGAIVLISTVDAVSPVGGLAHYCAAKAGLESLSRSAALELGARAIRVNAVAPGVVRTPLMAGQLARPEVERGFLERIPLGRIAEGGDIAELVAFLTSDASSWITGTTIPIDGGMHLREHPPLLPTDQETAAP
ncbi:SDR family NAD(P)-dependent oxidoreductase [Capillimicrobium parvum]|uniref:3-oxoacyl-[acyl-carrier-protein] reductase FabG n=1 Tax=Capillimicrobium parvum TaxID=2884022 RepID=A0A9E6XW55_9ACTN|nr:SDR family oxidoreductase [Capillimicrobium parvum]UGS35546.1 3-oxoacyl-[acyl-carrier-protein] reductase FabG [Capillimicrobium parvum]